VDECKPLSHGGTAATDGGVVRGGTAGVDRPQTGGLDEGDCVPMQDPEMDVHGRSLHSFTSQLNFSVFYGIGVARRDCVAHIKGVLGCVGCFVCVRHGSS
jgi:hypothetical protein